MDGGSLDRGQVRASVRFLASRWNWSPKKVYSFLTGLENDKRITWERPAAGKREGGTITICNYDIYQGSESTGGNVFHSVEQGKRESDIPATVSPLAEDRVETKGVTTLVVTGTQEVPNGPSFVPSTTRVAEHNEKNGQISFVEPVEHELTPNEMASMMIGRWVYDQPAAPPVSQRKKQFRIAVLICNEYEPDEIAQAWKGMPLTYPYSKGEPWDMFDFRRSFGKAFQNAASGLNEDVRWEAFFGKEEL